MSDQDTEEHVSSEEHSQDIEQVDETTTINKEQINVEPTDVSDGLLDSTLSSEDTQLTDTAEADSLETASPTKLNSSDAPTSETAALVKKKRHLAPEMLLPKFLRNFLGKYARAYAILVVLLVVGLGGLFALKYGHKSSSSSTDQGIVRFQAVPEPFQVVSSTPSDNQPNVSPKTTVTIKFSRAVDATKADGDFFFTPTIDGVFSQGKDETEIVFTPKQPFGEAQKISLMIHGEFASKDGTQLGSDYFMGFSTSLANNQVVFQDSNGYFSELSSLPSNKKQTFTLYVGNEVDPSGEVSLYKADAKTLLDSLRYKKNAQGYNGFISTAVNTGALKLVSTKKGLKDADTIDIQQDKGVYVLVATAKGKQVGRTWITCNDKGLLVRQDDEKIVALAEDLNSGSVLNGDVELYNLDNTMTSVGTAKLQGVTQLSAPYAATVDVVVATLDGDIVIAPLHVPGSLADVRVNKDLSTTKRVFATTDRPVYAVGDTVKVAGFARLDNDAKYTGVNDKTMTLLVGETENQPLTTVNAKVDASGVITADIPMSASYTVASQPNRVLNIFTKEGAADSNLVTIATFTLTSNAVQTNTVTVHFDKADYTANESVNAIVRAVDKDAKPLAGKTITVNAYSTEYRENDATFNESGTSYNGSSIYKDGSPQTLTLDGNGTVTVPVPISALTTGISQRVTVQADLGSNAGSGGTSAVVHQGNEYITFAAAKSVFGPGDELIGRVVAHSLDGKTLPNTSVTLRFTQSKYNQTTQKTEDKTLATATIKTDMNGVAEYKKQVDGLDATAGLSLVATVKDSANNSIEAKKYLYVKADNALVAYSHLQLSNIDISGTTGEASVGDTQNVTITAPADITALISYERGRVYKQEVLELKKGANQYNLSFTPELAPSFTFVMSYLKDGHYVSEGTTFTVAAPKQLSAITIALDKTKKNTITITTKDAAGVGLPSRLIIGEVDNSIFSLNDRLSASIGQLFYGSREITTNGSSSLTGLGSGGNGCGGGGYDIPALTNRIGKLYLWNTALSTDKDGNVSLTIPEVLGPSLRIYVYAANDQTVVGSASMVFGLK